jgi:ribose-phosphate pyrophosphokinase
MGDAVVERFPDGEVSVQLQQSVRRKEVFIIQPTSPPVDQNLMELHCWADACRRASAAEIVAVVPYFGYARSDKRHDKRTPIGASLVAQLMQAAGINHVITLDLHAEQIEGFFQIPVDSLTAVPVLCAAVKKTIPNDAVVVSPDMGRFRAATEYAQRLGLSVAVLHKVRKSGTETLATQLVGEVRGRACLIIDDMISTGGTIGTSVEALLEAGAKSEFHIAATHGLLLEGARQRLNHPAVFSVFVTDSIAPRIFDWGKLHIVSVAPLLASAIERVHATDSKSEMY